MTYNTRTTTPQTAGLYVQPSSLIDGQTPDGSADGVTLHYPLAFPLKHTDVKSKHQWQYLTG